MAAVTSRVKLRPVLCPAVYHTGEAAAAMGSDVLLGPFLARPGAFARCGRRRRASGTTAPADCTAAAAAVFPAATGAAVESVAAVRRRLERWEAAAREAGVCDTGPARGVLRQLIRVVRGSRGAAAVDWCDERYAWRVSGPGAGDGDAALPYPVRLHLWYRFCADVLQPSFVTRGRLIVAAPDTVCATPLRTRLAVLEAALVPEAATRRREAALFLAVARGRSLLCADLARQVASFVAPARVSSAASPAAGGV